MQNIDEEIQDLKKEAVRLLNGMFNIPPGFESDATRSIVDCIVSAAILEIANLNMKAKDSFCLGCKGLSVHHTCGKEPKAQNGQ